MKAQPYYPHRTRQQSIKTVLIAFILSIVAYVSFGQTADGYLNVQYLGYTNGKYKVQVKNLQNCNADIALQYHSQNVDGLVNYQIPANGTQVYEIPGSGFQWIKVKALTICQWRGNHPVWLILDYVALPVKIKNLKVTVIKN